MTSLSLEKIAQLIEATLIGDSTTEINGISTLSDANKHQISDILVLKYQLYFV